MPIITLRDLRIGFRGPSLLEDVTCQIEAGDRIGLLGRNGSGKTTLMRMICGDIQPDGGSISLATGTRVSLLPQDVPQDLHGTIEEIVGKTADAIDTHDLLAPSGISRAAHAPTMADESWKHLHRVEQILTRMELDGKIRFETLSSGMKRRVLLARALVTEPDVLLLDEPTNHLDIAAIDWLEQFLARWDATFIFVTHDRIFLRKLARRILEIDRGRLFDWSCDYDTFLKRKEEALLAEEKQRALFDKKLAQEEVWIRTGIKARRTRNEGRVRALEQLRRQRRDRRSSPGQVQLQIQEGIRSGMLVAKVDRISFAYGSQIIVDDFSTTLMRGDKIGIIGPNGVGKTTLLRLLLGQLPPQQGTVRMGTHVQIAYFDQLRQQLDDNKTVQENVGDGSDTIRMGDQSRHVIGYLSDFLFSPERARTPVRFLSGGERNRVLLARLFAKPANVIVLDEPTNDLDSETLEMLEDRLVEYSGTILLVSHDRAFLDNVVGSTIVFEDGGVKEYDGGYADWLRQRALPEKGTFSTERKTAPSTGKSPELGRRLTYKEQQELATLPGTIEQLEAEIARHHEIMAKGNFYQQPREEIARAQAALQSQEARLAAAYARWEELDSRS
jgi:ABC transport system ATP-binding/permease protein